MGTGGSCVDFILRVQNKDMIKRTTQKTGNTGEDVAALYARKQGWKVLERNFKKPWGEIDIIARNRKTIIFIEVKAQEKGSETFRPEHHFNPAKRHKLIKTCNSYLLEHKYPEDTDFRIDLAAVELNFETRNARVRYYKNAIG